MHKSASAVSGYFGRPQYPHPADHGNGRIILRFCLGPQPADERRADEGCGQPEPTQQPSAIERTRMAEAPGGNRNGPPAKNCKQHIPAPVDTINRTVKFICCRPEPARARPSFASVAALRRGWLRAGRYADDLTVRFLLMRFERIAGFAPTPRRGKHFNVRSDINSRLSRHDTSYISHGAT